jgi:hypothetical protein
VTFIRSDAYEMPRELSATTPSRQGQKQLAGYFPPEVIRTMKRIALDHETTIESLLARAINDLFEKHGHSRLANEQPLLRGCEAQRARRRSHLR